MIDPRKALDRLKDQLPVVKAPTLGTTVDVPVYVIHNSADAEDYFFIFDFEQFVERSRSGIFVRPKLKVWAGRNDFGRGAFARQFRGSLMRPVMHWRRVGPKVGVGLAGLLERTC